MRIYNTLGRRVEEFVPRDPGKVGMYVCGPTVQGAPHVGHGRPAVVFDVIRRYLVWRGFEVTLVANVTDIDDKILVAAEQRGVEYSEVAAEVTGQFLEAYRLLGVLEPDVRPYATAHIGEMIALIEQLVAGGHAYPADGDVYFSVATFSDYGKLSGRDPAELLAGARVEPGEHKRAPEDFALWKAAKPGEPSWDSPWGPGRPGWHIECSAMSRKYLGFGFDIHGGGHDLIFPHHENEIAQSEAASGEAPFARYWLHNGFVNLSGEKMSKSTGVVTDLLTVLGHYPPTAIRLFYLRNHYRKPVEFSEESLRDAVGSLERLWAFRRRFAGDPSVEPDAATMDRFNAAMDDDFDTSAALAALFDAVREGNIRLDAGDDAAPWVAAYDEITGVLGTAEPVSDLGAIAADVTSLGTEFGVSGDSPEAIVAALLGARETARADRDWSVADAIRDRLAGLGIVIEDAADGSRWHRG